MKFLGLENSIRNEENSIDWYVMSNLIYGTECWTDLIIDKKKRLQAINVEIHA